MGMKVFWDNEEKTFIRVVFQSHDWTWNELVAARHQGDELALSVRHRVGMILEEPHSVPMAVLKTDFSKFNNSPPNVVAMVIVANLPMVRAIVGLVMKTSPRAASHVVLVRTLGDARETITQRLIQSHSFTPGKQAG